jgi:hypothetical protein
MLTKFYFLSFVFFLNFNKKNNCFKTVNSKGTSRTYTKKTYTNYNKKNPDINVKKYTYYKPYRYKPYYNYHSYYRPYYNPYYSIFRPYYNPYYSFVPPYVHNNVMVNPYVHHNVMVNPYAHNNVVSDYSYSRYNYFLLIFHILIIILIIFLIKFLFFKKTYEHNTYTYNDNTYDYVNSKLDFYNKNTINNINKLLVPEILQIKIPDYDLVNYYIFNTRDDDNPINDKNIFINILQTLPNKKNVNNIEIILSPTNINFLNFHDVLATLQNININIHFAFVKEFYEEDFNLIELEKILRDLCRIINNDPIKIIGYNVDEENKNSFSESLNTIFNKNFNVISDFQKLQFVKN